MPARDRLVRLASWTAYAAALTGVAVYLVTFGWLLGSWTDPQPDAGFARIAAAVTLAVTVVLAALLVVSGRSLRPGRPVRRQVRGAVVLGAVGALVAVGGLLFRSGLMGPGDAYGPLAMVIGLLLLGLGTAVVVSSRRR